MIKKIFNIIRAVIKLKTFIAIKKRIEIEKFVTVDKNINIHVKNKGVFIRKFTSIEGKGSYSI